MDLPLIIIVINHPLYVGFFSSSQYGIEVLQTFSLKIPNVLVKATSCSAPIPHDLALLGSSNTTCNDLGKKASHICVIIPKELVNLKLSYNSLKSLVSPSN
jgi:hypothetical protein